MENEANKKPNRQLAVKILVPVALVCVVAGIWLAKNWNDSRGALTDNKAASSAQGTTTDDGDDDAADCCVSPPQAALDGLEQSEAPSADAGEMTAEDASMSVEGGLDLAALSSYGVPVIIKFGATWCGPCQAFAPILEEVHDEYQGKVIIKDVDIDQYGDLARQYPVSVVPTMVLIDSAGNPYAPEETNRMLKYYTHKETGEHVFTTFEGTLDKERLLALLEDMGLAR